MALDGTEPDYPHRRTLREVVAILDVLEPPEETDQEIELLLQSVKRDWSGLNQREQGAQGQRGQRVVLRLRLGYLNYATAQSGLRYVPWRSFGYEVRS